MNTVIVIFLIWLILGVLCVILSLWFMKTREEELKDEIFGCIPPPVRWGVIFIMLFFGPLVLLWSVCEAIRESRKEKDEDVTPEPPVPAVLTSAQQRLVSVVLYALIGAALCAWEWARECPPKSLAEFWVVQAHMGAFLSFCVLASVLAGKGLIEGLKMPVALLPLYILSLVPSVVSMTVEWHGGWLLGFAGAATGAAAGAGMGWLHFRWGLLSETDKDNPPSKRRRAIMLPIAFAVLLSVCASYTWAVEWAPPDDAWAIGLAWLLLGIPGALVGRPILGLIVMSPLLLVLLVPSAAVVTVGWEGGWIAGIVGATIGAAAGAVQGWSFNRWIMPEYDNRRARQNAVRDASPCA
jgi:hypothetical protein